MMGGTRLTTVRSQYKGVKATLSAEKNKLVHKRFHINKNRLLLQYLDFITSTKLSLSLLICNLITYWYMA